MVQINKSLKGFYFFYAKLHGIDSAVGQYHRKKSTMKKLIPLILVLLCTFSALAQEDDRQLLRGQVLYRNVNVPNENVINTTAETATVTNATGQFSIRVKEGDQLAFTAVNYELEVVIITAEILKNKRLVVEVIEKVTELDEVVVSPENQKKFLEVKEEEFKEYEYEQDRSSEVVNIAESQQVKGMRDGINFVNIFKALTKSKKTRDKEADPLQVSEALRQVYDDEFFVVDLNLPQDKIDDFLYYCDSKMPPQALLKKGNEFELIDVLVTHSKSYLELLNAKN